jgi:hypothetical protein
MGAALAKKHEREPIIYIQSHNQRGGITAHTVNIYGPLPAKATLSQIEHEAISEGHRYRATLSLETQYVLPVLLVAARGRTVQSIHVSPARGGAMMNVREGYFNDGSGWFVQFDHASGQYVVEVLTSEAERLALDVSQEAISS